MAYERQAGALSPLQYWILVCVGVGAVGLVLINEILASGNESIRARATGRQQFINQSVGLSRLHGEIVQALAALSIDKGDKDLRDVLALHGISFTTNTGRSESPAATRPAPGGVANGQ